MLELVTIVTFLVVVLGGKQKRETGWKVLTFMLMLVGIVQCAAMAIVVCGLRILGGRGFANDGRPTYLITTIDSLKGGSWIRGGSFVRRPGVSLCSRLASSLFRHIFSLPGMAMSLFRVSVMRGFEQRDLHAYKEFGILSSWAYIHMKYLHFDLPYQRSLLHEIVVLLEFV